MAKNKINHNNPYQNRRVQQNQWYNHYLQYLTSITYQLFEWEGLPDSVDPRYLEMSLHTLGHVGFYKHPQYNYLALKGAVSGTIDHYDQPTHFHVTTPTIQTTFPIHNYADITNPKQGIVIYNNDLRIPTVSSLEIFAADLAEIKSIISVNLNAQKTPVLITGTDRNKLSMKNMYQQYEGNTPAIYMNEMVDAEAIKVFKTDAPYVVDKLNTQKNAVWNEIMTFLGIKNANLEKRERMITAEADSNDEQIDASGNVMLKARLEACDRINRLYPELNVTVRFRSEILEMFENETNTNTNQEGGKENGKLHDDR